MRVFVQAVIVLGLAALSGGGWYAWQHSRGTGVTEAKPASRASAPVPVEVMPARAGLVVEAVEATGTARANESVTLTAKQSGTIAAINFEEGELVEAGATLVELEATERRADLDQARADLEQARAQRDETRQRFERAQRLRNSAAVAEARLDELDAQFRAAEGGVRAGEARVRAMGARLDDLRVTAPFAGRVGLRAVSLGALVQPGAIITTLDDVSKIRLDFAVPETALGRLEPGLGVFARTPAFPRRAFKGTVTVIDSRVDPATRSVRVNALIDNTDDALKPGMFLNVELALARREDAVLVPEEAIVAEGAKQFVFVVRDDRAERREVRLGQRLPGEVEVAGGLTAGENVVVRGLQKIRHNQPVVASPLQPLT